MNTLASDPLCEFISGNHVFWATRSPQVLAAYLAWFQNRDLLAVSLVGEEVFAVCAVRFFSRIEDFLTPWVFEPDGDFCMIELMVAASPLAMGECFERLVNRWGARELVLWERGDRTEKSTKAPRMFTWKQFLKLSRRITYGVVNPDVSERRI